MYSKHYQGTPPTVYGPGLMDPSGSHGPPQMPPPGTITAPRHNHKSWLTYDPTRLPGAYKKKYVAY